jgi:hypothetical protein
MMLMSKILLGVVVGLGYGVFVGGSVFLIALLSGGPPVDLMLDYGKIVRFLVLLVTIISGSAGALVGLAVTLLRVDKIKARTIGFSFGCMILAGIVFTIWPQLKNELSAIDSLIQVLFLLLLFLVLFIMFPIGLAATGVTAVRMSDKFASR